MTSPHAPQTPQTPAARRGFGRGLVLFSFVALVAVGLGVALGFLLFGGDGDVDPGSADERAAANAREACVLVERVDTDDPLGEESEESILETSAYGELIAIYGHAQAAGVEDGAYDDLAEQGELVYRGFQLADASAIQDAVDELTDLCAEID